MQFGVKKTSVFWLPYGETAWSYIHNTYHVLTHYPRMIDGQPDKQSDMPIIDLYCLCSAQLCYASVCKNDDLHHVLMSILQAGYTDSMNQMNARFSG